MGTGRRPRSWSEEDRPRIRQRGGAGQVAAPGIPAWPPLEIAWEFALERPTTHARQVQDGEAIFASFHRSSLVISSKRRGALGVAPSAEALRIRQALGRSPGSALQGHVLSKTVAPLVVRVRLSLGAG